MKLSLLTEQVTHFVKDRIGALRREHPGEYQNIAAIKTNSQKYLVNYFAKGQLTKLFFLFPVWTRDLWKRKQKHANCKLTASNEASLISDKTALHIASFSMPFVVPIGQSRQQLTPVYLVKMTSTVLLFKQASLPTCCLGVDTSGVSTEKSCVSRTHISRQSTIGEGSYRHPCSLSMPIV